ncbi:PilZ domain-containing protein [candidate division KSB1 bacterium]|nr:PilZ domain-containing protein [candidate division KSB1 bacterium]
MTSQNQSHSERRAYYRLPVRSGSEISAQINSQLGSIGDIQPINLSPGGLLCRLKTGQAQNEKQLGAVESVTLNLGAKGSVTVASHIRRLEYSGGSDFYYCAIQFSKITKNELSKPDTKTAAKFIKKAKQLLTDPIASLRQTPNYMQTEDEIKRQKLRNSVYAFFEHIIKGLQPEEQW